MPLKPLCIYSFMFCILIKKLQYNVNDVVECWPSEHGWVLAVVIAFGWDGHYHGWVRRPESRLGKAGSLCVRWSGRKHERVSGRLSLYEGQNRLRGRILVGFIETDREEEIESGRSFLSFFWNVVILFWRDRVWAAVWNSRVVGLLLVLVRLSWVGSDPL